MASRTQQEVELWTVNVWLTQEVQQAHGEALTMHVERFDGLPDAHLIELFRQARVEDYADIDAQAVELEQRRNRGPGYPRSLQPGDSPMATGLLA